MSRSRRLRPATVFLLLSLAFLAAATVSLDLGSAQLSPRQILPPWPLKARHGTSC